MASRALSLLLIFALLTPLLVAQSKATDDGIYDEVRRRLANDVEVKGAGIDVDVKNGAVTLKGRVHSDKAKAKATAVAKKVKGVTSVDNQLKLLGVDD
jgi:hyperosmotically inducible periplasmic protein